MTTAEAEKVAALAAAYAKAFEEHLAYRRHEAKLKRPCTNYESARAGALLIAELNAHRALLSALGVDVDSGTEHL